MSRILVFVFFSVVLHTSTLFSQGITFFEGSWKDAMAKAKAEDKLLFVDAYAKWCGPCKAMAKNVFTKPEVGDFFNANFINLKLDMEEADGVTFGHKYPVRAYPTLFFIDGDGKIVKNITGGQQPDGLISLGGEAMKKMDRSSKFEEKYNAGDRSYDLMYNYVKALNASDKPSLKISNEYLNSNPEITEEQRLKFLLEAAVASDSKLFDQVIANQKKIIAITGKEVFNDKCKTALNATVKKAIEYEMETLLTETFAKADKMIPDEYDTFKAESNMKYYKAMKNDTKYMDAYRDLAKKHSKDAVKLKAIITDIVTHFKDNKTMISDAADYAEKMYNAKETLDHLNIYCSVLATNNEAAKAIKTVEKARQKAEKNGEDLNTYDGLLRYLNSKKA
jgi:thioredoxin-related protein